MTQFGLTCDYATHRPSDWLRRSIGVLACGICHTPVGVPPEDLVTRADPDFDQLIRSSHGGQITTAEDVQHQPEEPAMTASTTRNDPTAS